MNSLICISLNLIVNNISCKIWVYLNDESSRSNVLLDASLVFVATKLMEMTLLNCLLESLNDRWYICEEPLHLGPFFSPWIHWSPSVYVLISLTTRCNCVIVFWQSALLSSTLLSNQIRRTCCTLWMLTHWRGMDSFLLQMLVHC